MRRWQVQWLLQAKYRPDGLRDVVGRLLGDQTLADLAKPVFIPVTALKRPDSRHVPAGVFLSTVYRLFNEPEKARYHSGDWSCVDAAAGDQRGADLFPRAPRERCHGRRRVAALGRRPRGEQPGVSGDRRAGAVRPEGSAIVPDPEPRDRLSQHPDRRGRLGTGECGAAAHQRDVRRVGRLDRVLPPPGVRRRRVPCDARAPARLRHRRRGRGRGAHPVGRHLLPDQNGRRHSSRTGPGRRCSTGSRRTGDLLSPRAASRRRESAESVRSRRTGRCPGSSALSSWVVLADLFRGRSDEGRAR